MTTLYFRLRGLVLALMVSLMLPMALAVDQYVPGTEAVMRAIQERYKAAYSGSYFSWPSNDLGVSPGFMPSDGFYSQNFSSTKIPALGDSIVYGILTCSNGYLQNPGDLEGVGISNWQLPSLRASLGTPPITTETLYKKLSYCLSVLPKTRYLIANRVLYPSLAKWRSKQDTYHYPDYPGDTEDKHTDSGWSEPFTPTNFYSSSLGQCMTEDVDWYLQGVFYQKTQNYTSGGASYQYQLSLHGYPPSASIDIFIRVNESTQGNFAAFAGIPGDNKYHKVKDLSGSASSGNYTSPYHPTAISSYLPTLPLTGPTFIEGGWSIYQSRNSSGYTFTSATAFSSLQFDTPTISPPKPQCITKCCDPLSTAPGQGASSPDVNIQMGNSYIDNTQRSHFHTAREYAAAKSTAGCGPCGGGMDDQGRLPALSLDRIHRYADMGWHGSFGPGVFLSTDIQLTLDQVSSTVRMFDPSLTGPVEFKDDLNDGNYTDGTFQTVTGLTTYNASGVKTSDEALMRTAKMTTHQKNTYTFELFPATAGVADSLLGRLKSIQDRNGNLITINYVTTNAQASEATLQYDRERLWQVSNITDAYGKSASFTWQRHAGQWVIATMVTPTSATITYSYNLNSLIGVNRITYPDGTQSDFSTAWDGNTQHQKLVMRDAGAEDIHRNKTLYLTTGRTVTGSGTQTTSQAPNRIWQVINGSGEISYRNQISAASHAGSVYGLTVYEGGGSSGSSSGSVLNLSFDEMGRITEQKRASSFSLTANNITASGWKLVSSYVSDAEHRITEAVSASGTKTKYVRNAAGSATDKQILSGADILYALESTTFNANQSPLVQTDGLSRVTEYGYDAKGNLTSKIAAKGTSVQGTWGWTYNSRGQPLSATDANGKVTDYVYEEITTSINYKRLISVIEPPDVTSGVRAVRSFTYDAAGRLATSTDAENRVATYLYDLRNRIQRITYHDATYEEWTYGLGIDANLLMTHRDRNGNVETMTYDATGRRSGLNIASPTAVVVGTSAWTYLSGKSLVASETRDGDTVTYNYDAQLRQISETRAPRAGATLTTSRIYGDDQRISYEQDAYGRRTYFLYNLQDLPRRSVRELIPGALTVPDSASAKETYLSGLTRVVMPNPSYVIEEMTYDVEGQLISRTDARGITEKMEWDEQGRMKAVVKAATNAMTEPPTIIANAERTEYGYDAQGNRTSVLKPKSFVRNVSTGLFSYAANLYATSYSYTGRNLLASVTEASGSTDAATVFYTYTLTKKKLTESDPRNATWLTTYSYYACCNRLYQIKDPAGKFTTYTYDAVGNVLTVRDPNNVGMTYTYDARHRALTATNTWGKITTYTYDDNLADGTGLSSTYAAQLSGLGFAAGADGSAVLVKNPLNEISLDIHDGVGRVVRRVDGNLNAVTVTYDTVVGGLVQTAISDALGNTTYRRQDAAGRDRVLVDALGMITTATFDANGNQLSLRDANLVGWTVADDTAAIPGYDLFNRLLKRTDTHGDATSMTYDLHGNVVTTVDALNKTMTCTYDFRDRKKNCTDRVAGLTQYSYDKANHLTKIKDADSAVNGVTDYTYDSRGLLSKETFPAGKDGKRTVRTYTYDNGKRLKTRTITTTPVAVPALNEKTTYSYNTANLLTKRAYNDAKGDDTFGYDNAGRLTSAVSGRYGNTVNRYYTGNTPVEKGGRLTSEKLTVRGTNAGNWTVKYAYDAANRVTKLTYPTNDAITRGYNERNLLTSVKIGSANVATRTYDAGGRLATSALGNNLVETRSYRSDVNGVDNMLVSQALPGVTNYTYAYDANKRVTEETDALFPAQTQQFLGYDNENRLTNWKRGTNETQSWVLSKVGDWTSTTINGAAQTRTHSAVHEVTALGATPINYDLKGNLTLNQDGSFYNWDSENRLTSSTVVDATYGASDTVTYRYDALGRRVQKTVYGMVTTFIHAGAQVVHEFDAKIQLPATSATDDGNGTGTPPGGGILQGAGVTRFNYQPSLSPIPSGFFADKGSVFGVRSNGKSYGWLTTARTDTVIRNQHPLPQFDSFNQAWLNNTGSAGTWEIDLVNGTYAVIVVMGDAASANQTNNLTIEGQAQTDPDPAVVTPPGYRRGDFDGYAVTANVTDGKLTLAIPATAVNPKLCFIEIGPQGSAITQADRDRLATAITDAGDDTSLPPFPKVQPSPRLYVYGSYVDEPLMMKAGGQNYYYATNRLYSVAAISDQSGAVVERYKYDAYGKQGILAPNGVVAYKPSDYGQFHGFTGRYHDWETGLAYFRARYFDHILGRFIGRDPLGYVDGMGLYGGYYIPNKLDPSGEVAYGDLDAKKCEVKVSVPVVVGITDFDRHFAPEYEKNKIRIANEMQTAAEAIWNQQNWKSEDGGCTVRFVVNVVFELIHNPTRGETFWDKPPYNYHNVVVLPSSNYRFSNEQISNGFAGWLGRMNEEGGRFMTLLNSDPNTNWGVGSSYGSVFAHELGHAMGLGHADRGNLMYTHGGTAVTQAQVNSILRKINAPKCPCPCPEEKMKK